MGALATALTSRWVKVCEDHHHTMEQGSSQEGEAMAQPLQGGFMDNQSWSSESEEERVALPREAVPREGSPLNSSDEFGLDF